MEALKMRNLILIDNNKDDLQFIKEALSSVDSAIECLSFIYSEEAIKAMMNGIVEKPDAVFMSLNLPQGNGIRCLMELRSSKVFMDLPVIVYAPKIGPDMLALLKDSGNTLFFEKPKTMAAWKGIVRKMLATIEGPEVTFKAHLENSPWLIQ